MPADSTITEDPEALEALFSELFGSDKRPTGPDRAGAHELPTFSDDEIIERATNARNGHKFKALWNGETSYHSGDDSVADAALAALIAFWTDDEAQIETIMRRSQLARPKWDERRGRTTYLAFTIGNINRLQVHRYRLGTQPFTAQASSQSKNGNSNGHSSEDIPPQNAGSATNPATGPRPQVYFTGSELLTMFLPEPKWAIPGLLPEGLSILGGKPKMGKSWMALGMSVAVATGGAVLGSIPVEQGDVLYLALEDNPRRLQSRLRKVLSIGEGEPVALDHLSLVTEWPRLDKTGLTMIAGWLAAHQSARLVVIDTWARIKARVRTNGSAYDEDYASVEGLQQLAGGLGVAILIITHLRKMDADDPLDTLNATLGFSGGADSILILKRERGRHDANLFVSGRDVEEQDLALKWDKDIAAWSIIGQADEYRQSEARKEILHVLRGASGPMAPKDVAEQLGKTRSAVTKLMWEMSKDDVLTSADGKYAIR